jgi:hypothetical protein
MRLRPWYILLPLGCLFGSANVEGQERLPPESRNSPNFWQAAAGVLVTNGVTWGYNRYIQRWPWARVGTRSWRENLGRGFVWDDNSFLDNQFAHPLHGSFYHNSARASGFGFWGSVPFVAVGSATWELFGETITASLNDLVTTTLGGVALGEVTYRLSTLLGASRRGGLNGFGRELGAFVLSPMARAQSLLHQSSEQVERLAEDRFTEPAMISMGRHSGEAFVELAVRYGNPFEPGLLRPSDAVEFRMQVSPHLTGIIQHLSISGLLTRLSLNHSPQQQLVVGVFQHYDMDDLPALQTSGHSLSSALLYQHRLSSRVQLRLNFHAEGLLLGTITSEHGNYWLRDYDIGPGAGARAGASVVRDGWEWLRADGRLLWLHSLYGSGGDHVATFLRARAAVPVLGPLALGAEVGLTTRRSTFNDLPAVSRRAPHVRAYLTWAPS